MSRDPLAVEFPEWSDYNYVFGSPITFVDTDGKAPQTDFYNLNGKKVKTVDDGKNEKRLLLTTSKKAKIVDKALQRGAIVPVPSNEVVKQMADSYTFTENTGNEHGFLVGNKGTTSIIVEGKTGEIVEEWKDARKDLVAKGDLISYDVHTHPLEKDGNGVVTTIGLPEPSETDKENVVGNEPNVVLGYRGITKPQDPNKIGGTREVEYKQHIGFYNKDGLIHDKDIKFSTYQKAVEKINEIE